MQSQVLRHFKRGKMTNTETGKSRALTLTLKCSKGKYKYLRRATGLMFYPTDHDSVLVEYDARGSSVHIIINSPYEITGHGEWFHNISEPALTEKLHSFLYCMQAWDITENDYSFKLGE
mgnify:FL=1